MSPSITTVLLDAGGVLLDETHHEATWREVVCEVLGIAPETYDADVEEAVRIYCPRVYRYVVWRHTAPDPSRFEGAWQDARQRFAARRPPLAVMPGIGAELERLAATFQVGIAGQYGAELLDTLDAVGLSKHLAWRCTQDDFDLTKPDPRYLLEITQEFGVHPRSCLMVGDRIDKDVVPARQVGMATMLVRGGLHRGQQPRLLEETPDLAIEGIEGLGDAAVGLAEARVEGA